MRRILPLLALTLLLASCSNPDDPNPAYKSKGLITGPDPQLCATPCCGGWFIQIEGKQYRFFSLPPNSDVKVPISMELLPMSVRLSWSKQSTGDQCTDDIITIHAIERE